MYIKAYGSRLFYLFLLLLVARAAPAQPSSFTYEGRLTESGQLASGAYDMQFKLFDSPESAGGVQQGSTISDPTVRVTEGVFSITLDFGVAVFDGSPRYLEISVKSAGSAAAYSILAPRQQIASLPYAIHSLSAAQLDGQPATSFLQANADGNFGIGTNTPAPGVRLEVNGTTRLSPGGSGGYFQVGTPSGETGLGVVGTNRFDLRFDGSSVKLVAGFGAGAPPAENGLTVNTSGDIGIGKNINFGNTTRQMLNLFGAGFGVGVQTADLYFRTGAGFAWHVGGIHNNQTYNSGGGTTPMTLDLEGLKFGARLGQHLWLWSDPSVGRYFGIGIQEQTLYSRCGGGGGDSFAWYKGGIHNNTYHNAGGGQSLMTLDGENGLFVSGAASVSELTIRGGADLAEPFPMKEQQLEKGSVVVIDDEHEGQLKLSTQPYDTRVAGIISGANGVNPGISLRQEGLLDSGRNVALSGRVYVLADATRTAIKPGDLLTTSETPGHAMKVSDHTKAQGAILGKAMSGLKDGKGTVLVLVTLQ